MLRVSICFLKKVNYSIETVDFNGYEKSDILFWVDGRVCKVLIDSKGMYVNFIYSLVLVFPRYWPIFLLNFSLPLYFWQPVYPMYLNVSVLGLLSSGIFAIEIEHCLCRSVVIFCKFKGLGEWISSWQSVYGSGLRGVRGCSHGDLDVLLKNL